MISVVGFALLTSLIKLMSRSICLLTSSSESPGNPSTNEYSGTMLNGFSLEAKASIWSAVWVPPLSIFFNRPSLLVSAPKKIILQPASFIWANDSSVYLSIVSILPSPHQEIFSDLINSENSTVLFSLTKKLLSWNSTASAPCWSIKYLMSL